MSSFIRFINNSDYCAICVLNDDSVLFSDILQGQITPYAIVSEGTRNVLVKQNNDKDFLSLKLSLEKNVYYTLVIDNIKIAMIEDLKTTPIPMFSYIRAANFSFPQRLSIMGKNMLFKDIPYGKITSYMPIISMTHNLACSNNFSLSCFFTPYTNYTIYMLKNTFLLTPDGKCCKSTEKTI
ncbi:MAG: DUF4397 domain-containing protein [Clostridia bacterium]|nr:DUF4397 domain-containing protein [Clostridia bacterium]